jgi:hypothetical protein
MNLAPSNKADAMSESPQQSPADNGDPPALSKADDYGDKGRNHLLTDFEESTSMDSDERYLVRCYRVC